MEKGGKLKKQMDGERMRRRKIDRNERERARGWLG